MDTNRFLRQLAEFLRETAERRALEWRNEIGEAGWVPCPSSPPRWYVRLRAVPSSTADRREKIMPDVEVLGSTMYYEDHGDGTPSDVVQRVEATTHGSRPIPRFQTPAHFDPGAIMSPWTIKWCRNHIAAIEVEHIGAGIHSSKRTMDRPSASPSPPGGRVEEWSAKRHERSARETLEPECTVPVTE